MPYYKRSDTSMPPRAQFVCGCFTITGWPNELSFITGNRLYGGPWGYARCLRPTNQTKRPRAFSRSPSTDVVSAERSPLPSQRRAVASHRIAEPWTHLFAGWRALSYHFVPFRRISHSTGSFYPANVCKTSYEARWICSFSNGGTSREGGRRKEVVASGEIIIARVIEGEEETSGFWKPENSET